MKSHSTKGWWGVNRIRWETGTKHEHSEVFQLYERSWHKFWISIEVYFCLTVTTKGGFVDCVCIFLIIILTWSEGVTEIPLKIWICWLLHVSIKFKFDGYKVCRQFLCPFNYILQERTLFLLRFYRSLSVKMTTVFWFLNLSIGEPPKILYINSLITDKTPAGM